RDAGVAPCQHVHALLEAHLGDLDRQIADLQALRHTVAHLHHSATTSDPTKCDTTTVCRYL
ncbi:MerR family DNA-binding protein, partial [Dietzia cinnamea]